MPGGAVSDVEGPQYLFLMRHAEHEKGHLTKNASNHVRAVAIRLSEWIHAEWRNQPDRTIRLWYTTPAKEVQGTVDLLTRDVVAEIRRLEVKAPKNYPFDGPDDPKKSSDSANAVHQRPAWTARLLPNSVTGKRDFGRELSAYSPDMDALERVCEWLGSPKLGENQARRTAASAPLLVGNDPLIGWLASKLSSRGTPVARGELICLVREPGAKRWRLSWTISEDSEAEAEAVRAKVKSKMTTAAALGTVIVGLTTFLLQNALQNEPSVWHWLSFAALGVSAALYFCSLFLYDGLQMPSRFWASVPPPGAKPEERRRRVLTRLRCGKPSVRRPPSSTARVLQTNMMQIWTWIFTPATILAGIGVALLAIGATSNGRDDVLNVQLWHVLVAIAGLGAFVSVWVAWQRPNLGTSD